MPPSFPVCGVVVRPDMIGNVPSGGLASVARARLTMALRPLSSRTSLPLRQRNVLTLLHRFFLMWGAVDDVRQNRARGGRRSRDATPDRRISRPA